MKRLIILTILLAGVFVAGVSAQWSDAGKLNEWTSETVSRVDKERETTYLKEVRVAKNKDFDRVVFQFTGDVPAYQIEFIKPPIVGTADREIKVGGKYFVSINLQMLPYPSPEDKIPDAKYSEKKLAFPVVSQLRQIEWFEGVRWFVAGLKAKKLYRVQQLENPARLVLDFQH